MRTIEEPFRRYFDVLVVQSWKSEHWERLSSDYREHVPFEKDAISTLRNLLTTAVAKLTDLLRNRDFVSFLQALQRCSSEESINLLSRIVALVDLKPPDRATEIETLECALIDNRVIAIIIESCTDIQNLCSIWISDT